jgi:hypothetical protein
MSEGCMVSVILYMVFNVWYLSCCLFVYAVSWVIAGAVEFKGVVSLLVCALHVPLYRAHRRCCAFGCTQIRNSNHDRNKAWTSRTHLPTYPPYPAVKESLMDSFYICFQKAVSSAAATTPFPHRFVLCLWRLPNTKSRICHCY